MAKLSISLLGSFQVLLADKGVNSFESNKVRALLAYLAVESNQPHRRETLATLFWPEQSEQRARRNLTQGLYNLRQAIGDHNEASSFLNVTQQTIQLNNAGDIRLDVAQFTALITASEQHQHDSIMTCKTCVDMLEETAVLYQGDFLEGFSPGVSTAFEEWSLLKREQYRRLLLAALSKLVTVYKQQGNLDRALPHAWRQVELDPWREEGQQQLMWLLALSGRRSEALSQYEKSRRLLRKDLGVEPVTETQALAGAIRSGRIKATTQNNLPLPVTPFVGRQKELEEIGNLLADPDIRMVTLVGLGGIGKTRLALASAEWQVAAADPNAVSRFPDGVYFVNLSTLNEPAHIVSTIINTLSISFPRDDTSEHRTKQHLLDILRPKRLLLVLDNFEQLTDGAMLVSEILEEAPEVKILVTSRERLMLHQENIYTLKGLAFPDPEAPFEPQKFAATQLFLQGARRTQPHFYPRHKGDLVCLAQICQHLNGMPLAIELAAAWVSTLSLSDILAEIKQSIDFLAVETRNVPDRHRSLRAVFESTWQRLNPSERRVMKKLAVFRGGFTRAAAKKIAGADLRLLASLSAKSLLQYNVSKERYDLHDLLRQYALVRLSPEETREIQENHLAYFVDFAETAEIKLLSIDQITWLDKINDEYTNIRAALQWTVENENCLPAGLRLAGALRRFWIIRDHLIEGLEWLFQLLEPAQGRQQQHTYAKALFVAGSIETHLCENEDARCHFKNSLALFEGEEDHVGMAHCFIKLGRLCRLERDWAAARSFYARSLEICAELGDKHGIAEARHGLARVASSEGNFHKSREIHEKNLPLRRELGDQLRLTKTLTSLGSLALEDHQPQLARSFFQEALEIFEATDYKVGIATTLNLFGELARYEEDFWLAADYYEKSMVMQHQLCNKLGMNDSKMNLGRTMLRLGDHRQAEQLLREGLRTSHQYRDDEGSVLCLEGLAGIAAVFDQLPRAATLFAAAGSWREKVDMPPEIPDRIDNERILASIRERMSANGLEEAWEKGQSMALDRAIGFAFEQ